MATLALTCFITATSGCGKSTPSDPARTHLGALASIYSQFRSQNRGQLPRNEADLRTFAEANGGPTMEQFGISDVDSLFVSERDNQPYTILFGRDAARYSGNSGSVIGYEKQGLDGQRVVGFSSGMAELVSEDDFLKMVPKP
ncbi:MAG: hypothetical protein KDA99_23530 [Planctomycetales bacterium]|nr:hypothetical protein [Planctomycetales bacterium]